MTEGGSYKYIGVMQAGGTKHHEMKEKVKAEYYRRVRKILQTKMNGGKNNIICKILCFLPTLDRGRIRENGEENKEVNDNASGIES